MSALADAVEYVAECATSMYVDGTPFFDWLDDRLGHEHFLREMSEDVWKDYGYVPNIVVTGKWGEKYRKWCEGNLGTYWTRYHVVVMPGDLRHREVPEDAPTPEKGKNYVFLDNSMYKGRTYEKTLIWFQDHDANVTDCRILYDGTLPPHYIVNYCQVTYYYRWHKDGIRVAKKRQASSEGWANLPEMSQAAV